MPILPGLCDDDANLRNVVRWTADHRGRFVLASGLTLADQQREFFFRVLREHLPDRVGLYQRFYPEGSYNAAGWPWRTIALRIRELCRQAGISDRIPRPILPGEKRALNKRIVEVLADQLYVMELNNESSRHTWAVRKAAWAIEDLEQDIGLVYRTMGLKGLSSIQNVGPVLAQEVESLIKSFS